MSDSCKEGVWLLNILSKLCLQPKAALPLHVNNEGAEALAKKLKNHARTKHIDIWYHFIRYIINAGSIKLIYCPTDDQTADVLTKALPSVKAKHFASAMGLRSV